MTLLFQFLDLTMFLGIHAFTFSWDYNAVYPRCHDAL